jgi:hypothetical protein
VKLINNTTPHRPIEAKSAEQLEVIRAVDSNILDLRQEMQMIANRQRQEYNSLISLIRECQQLTIKDRETRNQLLQNILMTRATIVTNPNSLSKETEENIFRLINEYKTNQELHRKSLQK